MFQFISFLIKSKFFNFLHRSFQLDEFESTCIQQINFPLLIKTLKAKYFPMTVILGQIYFQHPNLPPREQKRCLQAGNFHYLHKFKVLMTCVRNFFENIHEMNKCKDLFLPDLLHYSGVAFLCASRVPSAVVQCWDRYDTKNILHRST